MTLHLRLGETLLALGRLDEAEDQLARVLDRDPDNPRAHLGLAQIAWRRELDRGHPARRPGASTAERG